VKDRKIDLGKTKSSSTSQKPKCLSKSGKSPRKPKENISAEETEMVDGKSG
jgi:hypothetical protein